MRHASPLRGRIRLTGKIQERFGGQAEAQLETYAGRLAQLANSWDNVKEAIGGFAVQNEASVFALMR